MALIKCPKCGHNISDKAKQCPKCGHIIAHNTSVPQDNTQNNTPSSNKTNIAVITVLVMATLALGMIIFGIVIPASNGDKSAVIDTDSAVYAADTLYPIGEDSDSIRAVEETRSYEPDTMYHGSSAVPAREYTAPDTIGRRKSKRHHKHRADTMPYRGSVEVMAEEPY